MKGVDVVGHIERLEDQLQAMKWTVKPVYLVGHVKGWAARSIVTQTAGLLRRRLASGRAYERRIRGEWEQRVKRRAL